MSSKSTGSTSSLMRADRQASLHCSASRCAVSSVLRPPRTLPATQRRNASSSATARRCPSKIAENDTPNPTFAATRARNASSPTSAGTRTFQMSSVVGTHTLTIICPFFGAHLSSASASASARGLLPVVCSVWKWAELESGGGDGASRSRGVVSPSPKMCVEDLGSSGAGRRRRRGRTVVSSCPGSAFSFPCVRGGCVRSGPLRILRGRLWMAARTLLGVVGARV
ncbi:hypothetical protein C8Q73DRAFT_436671 [Cubamyces lactineus]|nr:hypothetical protein C8Q73DRAFT_436671 [Cubamyces lactineus]